MFVYNTLVTYRTAVTLFKMTRNPDCNKHHWFYSNTLVKQLNVWKYIVQIC